jgi:membrane carboxypeptidase/penicillin-binding protein
MAEDLDVKNRKPILTESYIVDAIRQQVIRELNLEDAPSQGYRIYTTIESELQEVAEKSLEEELRRVEVLPEYGHVTRDEWRQQAARKDGNEAPKYLQGAVLVLDNKTGGILAMVGGRSFNESPFNRALYSKRPAGTAFLPIVYAAAFEKGFYPGTVVQDAPIDNRQVMIGGTTGVLGEWGPERDDNRYEGAIPARRALVQSKNAATVRLGMQTGLQEVAAMAKKSGITSALRPFPATFLGSSEVTLAEMTLAFSSFAGKGWRPDQPFLINKIEDRDGKVLFQQKPGRRQVMRESVAWEVHSALADSLETGTADLAFSKYRLRKLPLGGKTGTAYNFTDVWFLGYDSEITCGVWAGLDRPEPIYRGAFSNKVALPIWVRIMNASFAKYSPEPIHPPPTLREIRVCSKSGQLAIPACEELDNAPNGSGKVVRTSYVEYADSHQIPDRNCTVHGEAEFIPAQLPPGEWPRAQPAVDVTAIDPVEIKAPTVVGTDPYHSVTPQSFAEASSQAASTSHDGPRVMRAEPVRPFDHSIDKPAITLEPPPPLKF